MSVFITNSALSFSGAFVQSSKALNSFVTSDRKTVRLYVNQRGPHWTNFGKIRCWGLLLKSVEKIQIVLKSGALHEDRLTFYCRRRHLSCHKHALLTQYYAPTNTLSISFII
jgi:hypothetical protein